MVMDSIDYYDVKSSKAPISLGNDIAVVQTLGLSP
jgi:hypothetical protein